MYAFAAFTRVIVDVQKTKQLVFVAANQKSTTKPFLRLQISKTTENQVNKI